MSGTVLWQVQLPDRLEALAPAVALARTVALSLALTLTPTPTPTLTLFLPLSLSPTQVQLPDRLEAPCVLSPRGRLLLVGCHDGYLYALCAAHGAQRWRYRAEPSASPKL